MADRSQPTRLIDAPAPCFLRLRKPNDPRWYPASIYYRLGMLMAEIDQQPADPFQCWHGGDQISESEYHQMVTNAARPAPF